MKQAFYIFVFVIPFSASLCLANSPYHKLLLEEEQSSKNSNHHSWANKTKDALLSVEYIENRTDILLGKLKRKTIGSYEEELILLAPFLTNEILVSHENFTFSVNYASEKARIDYKVRF